MLITPKMKRILGRGLLLLLVLLAALYAGDWAVLRIRIARQTAFSSVMVHQFLATPLKNHTDEYDYVGTSAQSCVRSIFPHASESPCWWLKRHSTQWE
jgi:hypothetical protein